MKVFAGLISLCAANAISNNKAADFDCVMDCYRNVFNSFSIWTIFNMVLLDYLIPDGVRNLPANLITSSLYAIAMVDYIAAAQNGIKRSISRSDQV